MAQIFVKYYVVCTIGDNKINQKGTLLSNDPYYLTGVIFFKKKSYMNIFSIIQEVHSRWDFTICCFRWRNEVKVNTLLPFQHLLVHTHTHSIMLFKMFTKLTMIFRSLNSIETFYSYFTLTPALLRIINHSLILGLLID